MPIYILIIKILGGGSQPPPPPLHAKPRFRVFRQVVALVNRFIILPNVCQTSVQAKSIINKPIMILPSLSQFVFNNNNIGGVTAPPHLFFNPNQPTFRTPKAPSSTGFQQEATQSPQNPVASAPSSRGFQQEATQNPQYHIANNGGPQTLISPNQALSSIYQAIGGLTAKA